MNLDELRSVQAKERRKDSVQHLRDSFYDDVAAYIADLRAARDRRAESVENPFSDDDVRRMSDEIETAEEVAKALYERRVGKVVKLASFAAADMPVETEGLTTQERALFDDLVERISENKSAVLDVLAGDEPPGGSGSPGSATTDFAHPSTVEPDSAAPEAATDTEPPAATGDTPMDEGRPDRTENGVDGPLADAMGATGNDAAGEEVGAGGTEPERSPPVPDDAGPATGSEREREADEPPADSEGGHTPVDPEPAPPDAPGVSDGGRVTGAPPSGDDPSASATTPTPDSALSSEEQHDQTPHSVAGDQPPADEERADDRASRSTPERTTVRITRDVGSILGVDEREYELEREDVVTLPAANAKPLVERDAAEPID